MKSLTDYTQADVTAVFEKYGAFWAFGNTQFKEKAVEGVQYVTVLDAGDCVPKENAQQFYEELNKVYADGEKRYLAEYGIEAIIKDELANQESYYIGDYMPAYHIVKSYGATEEQVRAIYFAELKKYNDW